MSPCFYKNLGPFSLDFLSKKLDAEILNINIPKNENVINFVGIDNCTNDDIVFANDKFLISSKLNAKFIIVSKKNKSLAIKDKVIFRVDDLYKSVAITSNLFYSDLSSFQISKLDSPFFLDNPKIIPNNSNILNGCRIGKNFDIGNGSSILENCVIGNNVKIGLNTVIRNAIIGDNVIIGSNTSIGQSGFGFVFQKDNNIKIYHKGRVIIQDYASIGCNCTVDRGSFSDTIIGENTYLDNLVHVAHNVKIGNNTAIAGQSGIAGSSIIGNFVKIGGQVGISGHISIGDYVEIAAKSGVRNNIDEKQKIMGDPAINKFTYLRKYKNNFLS